MSICYKLTASCAERDIYAQKWLQKVEELAIAPEGDGCKVVYFKSPLGLQAVQTKTNCMRTSLALVTAKVVKFDDEDAWSTARAAAVPREEPSSSSGVPGGPVVTRRSGFLVVMGILPTLTGAEQSLVLARLASLRLPGIETVVRSK